MTIEGKHEPFVTIDAAYYKGGGFSRQNIDILKIELDSIEDLPVGAVMAEG